jgi:membrane fusion protein, multidrug efflux system
MSNRHRPTKTHLAAFGLVLLALLVACGDDPEAQNTPADAEDTRRVINVEVTALQAQDFGDVIRLTGTAAADRQVTVSAEEGGTVTEVLVDKGTAVTEGQPLIRLDDDLLRAQRNDARAQSKLAQELWERIRRLYEEDGVDTESAYLESRYTAESAAARLALIEERLQRTTIRAPFAGILDTRLVEVGSVVAPGQAVGSIVDLTPLKVTAGVPERYAADVALGATAGVAFSDLGYEGMAHVSYVGAQIHPDNRTFLIELSLQSPIPGAKPQMVADVALQRRTLGDVITVPRQSLVRLEAGYAAFVVEDMVASARIVRQGPSASDRVVITDGLAAGDRLIVVGQNQVADGDRVRIVSER